MAQQFSYVTILSKLFCKYHYQSHFRASVKDFRSAAYFLSFVFHCFVNLVNVSHLPDNASWLDQFLTLALDAWILSKFSTLYWICLLLVFLILVGVELPLCL